jgi:hypothetical protein
MKIVISALLAYILSGISQVSKDLAGRATDRPMWTTRPTVGKALLVGATWIIRSFLESIHQTGQIARGIAFGLLGITLQMVVLTFFVWGCIAAAATIFDSMLLRLVAMLALMMIGSFIVLPLINVLMVPMTLVLAWPVDLLFPIKEATQAESIKWCRTCRHYQKSKEYEDLIYGLWRSKSMLRSDKLPCSIALETSDVWQRYFSSKSESRVLFPKDCPFYDKRP